MTKQSGLGANLYIDQYNISNDVRSVDTIGQPRAALDVTGIDKSAYERIHGLRDGLIEFTAFFNDAALQEHVALKGVPSTDRIVTYTHRATVGTPAASLNAKQIDYAPSRGDDGMLTEDVSCQGNAYGLEWGRLLTAGVRTDTSATNGASIDTTASLAFGLQAYLHVMAFTGTSVTIKIQDSADDSNWLDVASAAFTTVTAAGKERIAVSGTVRRYLRVITTGTFSNAQFAVNVIKNTAAVTF